LSEASWEYDLVEEIYAAALDAFRWQRVLDRIAGQYPKQIIDLSIFDSAAQLQQALIANADPRFIEAYKAYYVDINPWKPYKLAMPSAPEISWAHQFYPMEQFKQSIFYHELLRPAGNYCDGCGTVLFNEPERHVSLVSNHSLEHVEDAEEIAGLFGRIGVHMQRALEISRRFQGAIISRSLLPAALDCLDAAAFIIDNHAKLVVHNRAAEKLLGEKNVVFINREGQLRCFEPDDETTLDATMKAPRNAEDKLLPDAHCHRLYVRLKRPFERPLVALVAPLITGGSAHCSVFNPFGQTSRHFLILFISPTQAPRTGEDAIMKAFGVTKAEARLAVSLLSGKTMQDHAEEFKISKNTVRTQMKSLFHKTGTRGQTELIRQLTALFGAYRQE